MNLLLFINSEAASLTFNQETKPHYLREGTTMNTNKGTEEPVIVQSKDNDIMVMPLTTNAADDQGITTLPPTPPNIEDSEIMTAALILAAKMWGNGEFEEISKPDKNEVSQCIEYLERLPHTNLNENIVKEALILLKMINIHKHFDIVARHRFWIKQTFELLKMSNALHNTEELQVRIDAHDLSKYGPEEALGYSIMIGQNGYFRKLKGKDKASWEKALRHHYRSNSHHPQFWGIEVMKEIDLEQSIIDMLACRFELELRIFYQYITPKTITPKRIMTYLGISERYTNMIDRMKVIALIDSWYYSLEILLECENKSEEVKKWAEVTGFQLIQG